MNNNRQGDPSRQSVEFLQQNLRRGEPGILASYTLIGAVVVLGAIGYGLDAWNDTSPWCLLAGLLAGITIGFVNLAKTVLRH